MSKILMTKRKEMPYAVEEALNRLRINVSFLGNDVRTIMVVSSDENEGKSLVSMQLWQKLALSGTTAAFVDMDLRKSVLLDKYGIREETGAKIAGTSYVLSHDVPFAGSLYETEVENGYFLPNVDNVINPSILFSKKRMEDFMSFLRKTYPVTILDCPPLGLVSDGERIAELCDGAILVVRSGVTSKTFVRQASQQIQRAGCTLLGVVLNRVGGSGSGYYYKKYGRYGYGYGKTKDYYYGSSQAKEITP